MELIFENGDKAEALERFNRQNPFATLKEIFGHQEKMLVAHVRVCGRHNDSEGGGNG